jgi:hypothetical protein
MKDWRIFERLVASLSSDEYDESFTIIPNAKIKGFVSGRKGKSMFWLITGIILI